MCGQANHIWYQDQDQAKGNVSQPNGPTDVPAGSSFRLFRNRAFGSCEKCVQGTRTTRGARRRVTLAFRLFARPNQGCPPIGGPQRRGTAKLLPQAICLGSWPAARAADSPTVHRCRPGAFPDSTKDLVPVRAQASSSPATPASASCHRQYRATLTSTRVSHPGNDDAARASPGDHDAFPPSQALPVRLPTTQHQANSALVQAQIGSSGGQNPAGGLCQSWEHRLTCRCSS
jgi:hypothetical protein